MMEYRSSRRVRVLIAALVALVALGAEECEQPGQPVVVAPSAPFEAASIRVDAGRVIRTIPRTLYGTNVEWIFFGNGVWDQDRNALRQSVLELTRDLGVSLIRFPGGAFSDFYRWDKGIGPRAKRPTMLHLESGDRSPMVFGTDEALRLAEKTGAELLITVNAGTGTAKEAAEWVRYVNGDRGSHRRVRYWEVGNELYMAKNDPTAKAIMIEPEEYVRRFFEFARAMRSVDPEIRIGAIGGENYGRYALIAHRDWNPIVLSKAGAVMDFFSVHNAYAPLLIRDAKSDLRRVYMAMLAAPVLIAGNLATVSRQIETHAGGPDSNVALAVTEWGPFFHVDPRNRYVDHVKTLGSALFVASTLKAFIESPRTEIANFFKLVDHTFMGWIGIRNGGWAAKAPYLAFEMYTHHFGERLIHSSTDVATYDSPATGIVDTVRGVPYLDVIASLNGRGDRLFVMAINKSLDQPMPANLQLTGFRPRATATVWTLNGTGIDANTGTGLLDFPGANWGKQAEAQPNPRFYAGGPGEVKITSGRIEGLGEAFRYEFPAHSVTVLELERAS